MKFGKHYNIYGTYNQLSCLKDFNELEAINSERYSIFRKIAATYFSFMINVDCNPFERYA